MIDKIKEAYIKYINSDYSSRNQESSKIMHDAIRDFIQNILDDEDNFKIKTANHDGEHNFTTRIREKRIDITVYDSLEKKPIVAISFKMPLSSVNKNLKNYFEMNIGDSSLVREGGIPFFYFMILDKHSMKFDRGKYRLDDISSKSIEPFSKVMSENCYSLFRPNQTFIAKIDFGDKKFKDDNIGKNKKAVLSKREEQLEIIKNYKSTASVYTKDGEWTEDFDKFLEYFKKSIELEIELYKIRKKL